MDRNAREVGTLRRARARIGAGRPIGGCTLICTLATLLSAATPCGAALVAAPTLPAARAAAADAVTCEQASGEVAIAACTRAIASGTYDGRDLAKLHYDRAVEHGNKGDNDRALADFSAAIRLDPKDASFYNNRANAWRGKGDNYRAIADYGEARRLR